MDKLDLKIRQVKLARMKPVEKFMYELFSNLVICHFENIVYYKKDNKILLEYNNNEKILYCSNNLWRKLINDFNIKLQDMNYH
jgi:hypothetical protein